MKDENEYILQAIKEIVDSTPNDQELGEKIREIFRKLSDPSFGSV